IPVGTIGYAFGDYMAACMPFTIRFYGKTSHAAAAPEKGIDAIKMGIEAYHKLGDAVKEAFGEKKYIWNVGVFRGGTAHNVIADYCELRATFRYFDSPTALAFREKATALLNEIASRFGGRVEVEAPVSAMPVYNDPALTQDFVRIMKDKPGIRLVEMPARMSSEDFSWYLPKAPGFIFRYGTRMNENEPYSPAHSNTFCVNEDGMKYALDTFIDYVRTFR
ncbi:MAG: amidohydrolase, partial [Lachnospiraceae bacterium]|nr:amidohydrolase [Lachnospiraceae bacterium]